MNADTSKETMIPRTLSPKANTRRTMSPNASPNASANDIEPGLVSPSKSPTKDLSVDSMRNPMLTSNE